MTKILEKAIVNVNCPHCKKHVSTAWICKLEADRIIRYIYFCPNCQKPMQISDTKTASVNSIPENKSFQI